MAHLRCDVRSESLDMITSLTVVIPDGVKAGDVNVVYLLHGLADNCTGWSRYTSVERYARSANVALVIPEVERSFYCDMVNGLKYFSYVSRELPEICRNLFSFSQKKEKNYIMGFSMGGYGALKCMLTKPSRYAGCAVFSSVTDIEGQISVSSQQRRKEYQAIFGSRLHVPASCNLYDLLEKTDASKLGRIYMTCGLDDDFLCQNEDFSTRLKEKGIDCTFSSWKGGHEWSFWDESVNKAFDFFFS